MGYCTEINWILKTDHENDLVDLKEDSIKTFQKAGKRIYPIGMHILLVDKKWNAHGYIRILESKITEDTEVKVHIVRLFTADERKIVTAIINEMYCR